MVVIIVLFILSWAWIAHEMKNAPLIEDETFMEREKKWYIDQYNRNRAVEDQITTWQEFKEKTNATKKTI